MQLGGEGEPPEPPTEEECPLFLGRLPHGDNAALSAIAALIDEDEAGDAGEPVQRGRKRGGTGELQVVMALSGLDDGV